MNKELLAYTATSLNAWLTKCREETVSDSKKLELIMFNLAEMCRAMCADTPDEAQKLMYGEDE